jgi:glycosyltransferase involved in cell wall biosynthesis
MKILCVIDCLGSGGSQRQIVELALGFKEKGHTVSFLTYHNIVFYDHLLLKEGIAINCIDEKNYLIRILKMRKLIRKGKYDGIVAFLEGPNFICEVAGFPRKKWKLIINEGSANPNIYKSLKHIIYRIFHVFSDYVVTNSYANMRIIRAINPFLSKSACKVVYNIIDFEKWKPSDTYTPRKNNQLNLIVVASHQYLKNLNGLIDALSLLTAEELSKIRINWYGDRVVEPFFDHSIKEAKKKIDELKLDGLITFHPATNLILKKIQDADALGLFSYYEGFPNVVCEAMSCQKPVLSSTVSDIPDLLLHEENLLCDPADPESIRKSLSYAIGLKADELIRIGRKNEELAKVFFDKEKNISAYIQMLSQ